MRVPRGDASSAFFQLSTIGHLMGDPPPADCADPRAMLSALIWEAQAKAIGKLAYGHPAPLRSIVIGLESALDRTRTQQSNQQSIAFLSASGPYHHGG